MKAKCKKLLSVFLSIAMLFSITAGVDLSAYAETSGDFEYYVLDDGTAEIINYKGSANYLIIPSTLAGYSVTSIRSSAFYECTSLTSITIPSNVKNIGGFAFGCCYNMTSITVSSANPYYSSKDGVLFNKDKTGLIQYPIGNSRTTYEIPNSVTRIYSSAFYNCTSLINVKIPNSVTNIGGSAFANCSSITNLIIPESIKNLGDIGGNSIFYGCTSLKTISLPNGLTHIGSYVFKGCKSLTEIVIPDSVTGLGSEVFSDCTNLEKVYLGKNVVSICEDTFENCTGIKDITISNDEEFQFIFVKSKTRFNNLETVSLGAEVSDIYQKNYNLSTYFSSSSYLNIKNINVSSNNQYFSSKDGVLFNKDKTKLIQYPIGNTRTGYIIPDTVKSIGEFAFKYCGYLDTVTIPDSVTSIGDRAFYGCESLTSVTIPNSVTSIGKEAFCHCLNLTSVTIPNSVTSIGAWAFNECESLSSVTIPNSVTIIGRQAFGYCSSLTGITIPNNVKSIDSSTFFHCKSLKYVIIPSSVVSIGVEAFYSCSNLSDIYYCGTEQQWDNIEIFKENEILLNSNIHFNYIPPCNVHIPAKAITENHRDATCVMGGSYDIVVYCSVCKRELNRIRNTSSKTDHKYDSGKVTTSATCVKDGTKIYTCTVCGSIKTETISKKQHTPATAVKENVINATCTTAGSYDEVVYCSVCGEELTRTKKTIAKLGHNYKTTTTKATQTADGKIVKKCSKCNYVASTKVIPKVSSITISTTKYTYDGNYKEPSVTIKDRKGNKLSTANYTVAYSNNKYVGKASVKVTLKGNYSGTKTLYFTINPKGTTLSTLTATSKGFKVTWKKQATQTTGYQIQYATNSKFDNAKTVTVTSNSTTSKTISKLTAKKKYYVRIRTYKVVNGTKYYSGWSGYKYVTTKI